MDLDNTEYRVKTLKRASNFEFNLSSTPFLHKNKVTVRAEQTKSSQPARCHTEQQEC